MLDIKTVGLIAKPAVDGGAAIVSELVEWLEQRGIQVRCDEVSAEYSGNCKALPRNEVPLGCDLIIILGGDGTLLAGARALGGRDIPLLAVNLGGLGFLTTTTVEDLYGELERVLRGEARIGKRSMVECELVRGDTRVAEYQALNDIVLNKAALARMMDMQTYVDNHFVCSYKADGLIIATPTGSTAYSLSAGGPIIFPTVAGLCVTPICPHTLTNRPVIVPDSAVISVVCLAADDEAYLTIDGQIGEPLRVRDRIVCRASSRQLRLIRPPRMRYFDVLRAKLKWGER
jgi:NAD+ kinase